MNSRNATKPNTTPTKACASDRDDQIAETVERRDHGHRARDDEREQQADRESQQMRELRLREHRDQGEHHADADEHEQHRLDVRGREREDVH